MDDRGKNVLGKEGLLVVQGKKKDMLLPVQP